MEMSVICSKQSVGLVGGWWKGLFQNLGRRKLSALQVAQTRFSQSDSQDHQVLYSMEIIRPHYYLLRTKVHNLNYE